MKKVMVEVASPTTIPLNSDEDAHLTFKVLLLGDSNVGKSSLIECFISEKACSRPKPPDQQNFRSHKPMTMRDTSQVTIQLCETQKSYATIEPDFSRGAVGAFVTFDLTERDSFDSLQHWVNLIKEQATQYC